MADHPASKAKGVLARILNLDDFEAEARRFLPRPVFEYVAGGVEDNVARDGNRAAFADWDLVPRVLVGVKHRSTQATLLGREYASPVGIAPIGIAALYAYRGDIALAKAAAAENAPMMMSGSSLIAMEDVRAASPEAWFQAYLPGASCGARRWPVRGRSSPFSPRSTPWPFLPGSAPSCWPTSSSPGALSSPPRTRASSPGRCADL